MDATRRGIPHAGPSSIVLPHETIPGRTLGEPRRTPLFIA